LDENLETPKTIEQLDTFIANAHDQKQNRATYIILSLLLPPFTIYLALFLSYRKKLLHVTLPVLLIFYSAITVVINLVGLINVGPPSNIAQLGVVANQKTDSQVTTLTILTTFLAFSSLLIGFYFRKKAKKDGNLSSNSLWMLFFVLNFLIYGVIFLMFKEASVLFSSISPAINNGYQGL